MKLHFLGAAGTVTGSRYLLQTARQQILVDCGLFQGYKQLRLRNRTPPPFDPAALDAVVLTHAHVDHSGYLPALVRQGFRGPVYCSAATQALCKVLLPDSARLQEEEARFANRHGFSKHRPATPLYTADDAGNALELFQPLDFRRVQELSGLHFELHPAGHLLGAAFIRFEAEGISLTFSGDLGRSNDPLMFPPAPLPATDYLVTESTYGDHIHPATDPEQELAGWLARALGRGGTVVMPAFSVGRTQALLLHVARLKERRAIAEVPVFIDSPMAIDATSIYERFHGEHRLSEGDYHRMRRAAQFVTTPEGSKQLDRLEGPAIILSASGMATGGRVVHHLKAYLGGERNLVLFGGYQAAGTRGWSLLHGAESVRIHGREVAVKADVGQLETFSSHADAGELLAWMTGPGRAPRHTFVTHGEPAASEALRMRIDHQLDWPVAVPEHRDVYELSKTGFRLVA